MNSIKHAKTDTEINNCFEVMYELRTHLKKNNFLTMVRQLQTEGLQLAYLTQQDKVVTVAGYRVYSNLFMGKHLYVDDLVTASIARSQGFGEQMIRELRKIAIQQHCQYFHLDSGTQRKSAHKFYLNQGLTIASFHFSEALKTE